METISSTNRFRNSLGSLTRTTAPINNNNNNRSRRRMKTTEVGDISMYLPRRANFTRRYKPLPRNCNLDQEPEQEPLSPSFRTRQQVCKPLSLELQKNAHSTLDRFPESLERERDKHVPVKSSRGPNPSSMRDMLSQLYTDKGYFEKTLRDTEANGRFHDDVSLLAGDGLAFVAQRMLFWAHFGAPAPPACASGSGFKSRKTNHDGLQPVLSARQGRSREASFEGKAVTSEREEEVEMTSLDVMDKEAKAVTWEDFQGESFTNNMQEQETDTDDQHKRSGRTESELGKARASGDQNVKKRKLRKRRKKKTASAVLEENVTSLSDSDAEKLKFNFDTYRPPTSSKEPQPQGRGLVPPLVGTVEDLSTDDWDSEWDDCEEGGTEADGVLRSSSKNHLTVQNEANMADENPDAVRLCLLRVIRDLHAEFDKGGYLMVREKVLGVLADLDKYRTEFMADKLDLVATLHGLLGNAYLEINDLDLALKYHRQDLCIGQQMKSNSIASRALGNLGRTHIARKDFHAALECFAGKSKHASTSLEKAWLYQEIAHCFLRLRHFEFARDAAAKALGIATQVRDTLYQLQAAVLLAISEMQLKKYDQAHEHFTAALEQARLRENAKAESSIRSALHLVNERLAALARERQGSVPCSRPHITHREEALMKASWEDEEDPELAGLKESDTDSVQSQEQQVIQAASALAALSAKSANQPPPHSLTEDLPREKSEDLVPQQQADKRSPGPPSDKLRPPSSPWGGNLGSHDPLIPKQDEQDADNDNDDNEKPLNEDNNGVRPQAGEEDERDEDKKEDRAEEEEREEEEEGEKEREPSVDPVIRHLAIELKGIEDALKAEDAEGVRVKALAALDSYTEEELQQEEYLPLVAIPQFPGHGRHNGG